MKQYKKKEILETADLLIEGNRYITDNYRTGSRERIVEILTQCQEMAILLGNCLETVGDFGRVLVPVLEDYCEKIYQFSQNLTDEIACRKIAKQTTRQLANLKVSIIDQIPEDKIEIVFLPYKAAMWDSLESVWRAADEDPECDAYVVPIPYFERDTQGQLAVMHYEGDQFPEDVPVIHYLDYNMAEKRPDVVFIHNPYDKNNHVTSIHPAYYVSELKKYAGKVAYIPYFVSPEPNPDNLAVQEQKKGFVIQPGVIDTDLVFVQSEDMKKLYLNILEKEIPNVSRKYWEDKIFGLGSPKLDRVHSTKRNDALLSSEWYSLIYDSKGNRKKVILYNTSLHDLLNQKNMMEKIADTLAFFKEREDCVLWWRPHPLYESTLASMIPGLLPVYRKIVEDYRAEKWGILDEGEDLDWAIAETDAYYGDGSSVVELYKEAGKPVLYQDTRVKNAVDEEVEIPIWPCAFCVDGDDIWFVHGKINLLIKYNIQTRKNVILGSIPGEVTFKEMLYESIYKYKNLVFLIPCWASAISVYDIDTKEFERIELRNCEEYQNKLLFKNVYRWEKYLYCIPYSYSAIIKLDMEQKEITYIDLKHLGKRAKGLYINESTQIGNCIYATWNNSEYILILDLNKEKVWLERFGQGSEKFSKLSQIDNYLYLYDDNHILWKRHADSSSLEQILKVPYRRFQLYKMKDRLFLTSENNVSTIMLDLKGYSMVNGCKKIKGMEKALDPGYIDIVLESGNEIETSYYFDKYKGGWIFYERAEEILNDNILKKYLYEFLKDLVIQECMAENELFNLDLWIKTTNIGESVAESNSSYGIKIINKVMGVLKNK